MLLAAVGLLAAIEAVSLVASVVSGGGRGGPSVPVGEGAPAGAIRPGAETVPEITPLFATPDIPSWVFLVAALGILGAALLGYAGIKTLSRLPRGGKPAGRTADGGETEGVEDGDTEDEVPEGEALDSEGISGWEVADGWEAGDGEVGSEGAGGEAPGSRKVDGTVAESEEAGGREVDDSERAGGREAIGRAPGGTRHGKARHSSRELSKVPDRPAVSRGKHARKGRHEKI